jgi:hypothetical protein
MKQDAELKEFRDLLPPPDKWEEGFGLKAMIGAIFVGMIMTPASMYMSLVIGADIGQAAQWVTVILFLEIARRSFTIMQRPEIYVLYYMAGAAMVHGNGGLLWNQFLVQSDSMRQFALADKVPDWVAPASPDVLGQRSFFHQAWLVPIGLMALGQVLNRLDNFGLAYVMYRLCSDVEKLPFPLAPVGAQGITALADASGGKESWRWRVFSFGGMLGIAFGAIYFGLPAISGAVLGQSISIFPIPFYDATPNVEDFLPAVPFIISFNIGLLIAGMVLPFWAMVGSFLGLVVTLVANPLLYHFGILDEWSTGLGAIRTIQSNRLDFYFSFGLGLLAAIALIGFWSVFRGVLGSKRDGTGPDWRALLHPPPGRGDFSLWLAIGVYVATMGVTILCAYLLLDWSHRQNPTQNSPITMTLLAVFVFYGFIYTPIISYVSARLEGVIGQSVQIPFVREATFILSGYQGAAIWFAPFPMHNYGAQSLYFRKTELTGTSFRSMIKAELFVLPIVIVATVIFSHFIWRIAPVPSAAFPYAEKFWELQAFNQGLIMTSTTSAGTNNAFAESFNSTYLFSGLGIALVLFMVLSFFGLPVLLVYGLIRGLDQSLPDVILPQFLGALIGRYYFKKKFGPMWNQYIIVFFAGFQAGLGLISMLSLGIVFMSKAVIQSAY